MTDTLLPNYDKINKSAQIKSKLLSQEPVLPICKPKGLQ